MSRLRRGLGGRPKTDPSVGNRCITAGCAPLDRPGAARARSSAFPAPRLGSRASSRKSWLTLLAALLAQGLLAGAAAAEGLEYVYIEPNAGSSAGGHGALRVGDDVFDFQNHQFDTLRLRRTRWDEFRYLYTVLENRTLHIARIETAAPVAEAIRNHFNRRFLKENRQFARLDEQRRDRVLLEGLAEEPPGVTAALQLRGSGFFYGEDAAGGGSKSLPGLETRIAERHGMDFVAGQQRRLEAEIAALAPTAGFARRLSDLSLKLLALRVLDEAHGVRPGAMRRPDDDSLRLDEGERARLTQLSSTLESALVDLFASQRPDWGYPALLGMARLEAIAASLEEGRWIVLDGYPADSRDLARVSPLSRAFALELLESAESDFAHARAHLASANQPAEPEYARLEEAANRVIETREGLSSGRPIRIRGAHRLPAAAAVGVALPLPAIEPTHLERAARAAAERESAEREALRSSLGYHLVERNCITEIFATLEAELGREGVVEALGGYVEPGEGLAFIPALSYRSVIDAYHVSEIGEIPSLRRTRMAEQYETESDFWVYLRESNTLSSTIYRRNDLDPFFLFFTDDAVAPRPLFGALNVVAGVGQTTVGLLRAPFDRGATLWSGIRGVAFSLPELFFVNLRKGVLEYAPSEPPRTVASFRPSPRRH
jgi:hypothetical protein